MNKDTHGSNEEEWIGFDLDGTLAKYDGWKGIEHIGDPVDTMVIIAKMLHKIGKKIKVLTARVAPRDDGEGGDKAKKYVEEWCKKNLGFVPEITYEKDASMAALFDDRAVAVEQNTGKVLGGWPDFLPKASDKAKRAVLGKTEKKAGIDLKDGKYDDVKRVYDGLTDEEKNFVTPGRRIYKDVPRYLAGRTVAYDGKYPIGFSDVYGYNNDGSMRSSPNICLAVSEDGRGKRLAGSMTKDVMRKVLERAKELRAEKGIRADKIKRFVWMVLKENEASARAAINSGFKEVPYRDGKQRKFIMSRRDAEKSASERPSKEDLWRMYDIMQADARLAKKVEGLGFGRSGDAYRKAAIKLKVMELARVVKDGKRIRNNIAHMPGYVPSRHDAERALRQYTEAEKKVDDIASE